jgi:hypothetical protein
MEPEAIIALGVLSVTLMVSVIGQIIANLMPARMAAKQREADRRKEWEDALETKLNRLIELRRELELWQGVINLEPSGIKTYGETYAVMLSVPDEQIRQWAASYDRRDQRTRYAFIEAVDNAIMRLGDLIGEERKS